MSQTTLKTWVILALFLIFSGCDVKQSTPPQGSDHVGGAPRPIGDLSATSPFSPAVQDAPIAPAKPKPPARVTFVSNFQEGYEIAQHDGKPMLLFFTAEWCKFCHQMADEAFIDGQVVTLADRFVCVMIDADVEGDVCRHFRVRQYPTLQFVSHEGAALHRMVGKRPSQEVVAGMHAALQALARAESDNRMARAE